MNFEIKNEKYLNQIIDKKKYKKIFIISGYKSFKYSGIKKVINFNNKKKNSFISLRDFICQILMNY